MFDWELELAPSKYVIMRILCNYHPTPPPPVYSLNGVLLPVVKHFKDLCISFCDNLSFNIHFNSICSKAYILIYIIVICFITNDYLFLLQAYISYVRPILEFNSYIWNPHTHYIGNSKALERVQRLFTKRLFYRCNISMAPYSNRLIYFNIKSIITAD